LGISQHGQKTFWVGGSLGFSAYAIVLWACLHAPISIVYTLRETSVLFAILLAIVFLKEKITFGKTLLIGVLCLGVVLIKSSQ
jgi:drug/metabolite transporter (DMT)-like permease